MKRVKDLLGMRALMLLAVMTAACSDNDGGNEESAVPEPKLLSFGFYAEDNKGVLAADYVAETIPSDAVTIAMPSMADKSHLVARFTTNEGNTVLVDGVTQESGKTENDYTVPVDFIVSNGTQNAKYTVTVTKASNMAWVQQSTFADAELYNGAVMKVNPADGVPYVAYKDRDTNKMTLLKSDGSTWKEVGKAGFSTVVASSDYDFDFDAEGTPYVAYSDEEAANVKGAPSLMKWNGTSWEYLGKQDFAEAQSQKINLVVTGKDQAFMTQVNNDRKVAYPRRALIVSTYTDNWNNVEPFAGIEFIDSRLAKSGNDVYLFTLNRSSQHSVYRYNDGTWEPLLTNHVEGNATGTAIVCMQLIARNDGTLYLLTADDAVTKGVYLPRLKAYDPSSKQWSTVGGKLFGFHDQRCIQILLGFRGHCT